ncbi:basic leucine zipper 61-like [Arachis ipaensis]|uniref:basic leucine zipper 61-like n=1 Tax=Arachis ipaensis TaxID=130454 RepID=UPI0007AF3C6D|nr:basic leucine zipper 61-like [Arachis ipaensis]
MAQLPPKIPNMASNNWPEFSSNQNHHHQKMPSLTSISTNTNRAQNQQQQQNPSWVDEFLDFSSARRGAHRRSMSDSIFVESPRHINNSSSNGDGGGEDEFERFDDYQFMNMFSDEVVSGGDNNTNNSMNMMTMMTDNERDTNNKEINKDDDHHDHDHDQQQVKVESDEDESQCNNKALDNDDDSSKNNNNNSNANAATTNSSEKITDPKRVKRILANRQSAQRSRVRKLQYISELERSVTSLQAEVSVLSPRVAFLDHQRLLLNVDNSALKQRIAALAQDKIFKDAHQEALKREIERLRQVYHQLNVKKNMEIASATVSPSISPSSTRPRCDTQNNEKEQLINV